MEKTKELKAVHSLDDETIRMVERMVIIRISTKHINLWIRQLEMKRKETGQQAVLMRNEEVKREIERRKSLEFCKDVHKSLPQEDKENVV